MNQTYQHIIAHLSRHNIPFTEYSHDPILSYEDAEREQAKHGWEGTESKSVFLKSKSGKFYVYTTTMGEKVNFAKMKEITGEKMSVGSAEDLQRETDCIPGCVCPFGFKKEISIIVDTRIFELDAYLFSPGVAEKTLRIEMKKYPIRKVFASLENEVILV